jgi:hypothetical protein
MDVHWNLPERESWDALHRNAAGALQQDWAYGDAMQALGTRVLRAHIHEGEQLIGVAQCLVRRVAGIVQIALCSHGPVWAQEATVAQRSAACRLLKRSLPLRPVRLLFITPDLADSAATGTQRMVRVVTGQSTVRISLESEPQALRAALQGKWRNRLAGAERSALTVHRVGYKPAQYRWLLERELAQRAARRYIALPDGFVEAWQQAHLARSGHEPLLTLRADLGRDPVAGMLFLVHGEAATYQIGWVGEGGRELGAHNLLLWQAMLVLRERGVRRLDLGGVDTARGAGLARFKIATGGEVITLAGTYL